MFITRQQENQSKQCLAKLQIFFIEGFCGLKNFNWTYYKQKCISNNRQGLIHAVCLAAKISGKQEPFWKFLQKSSTSIKTGKNISTTVCPGEFSSNQNKREQWQTKLELF